MNPRSRLLQFVKTTRLARSAQFSVELFDYYRLRPAGMTFEIDMPDSDAGRAVIAAHEDAGVIVRPFVDADSVAEPDGDNNLIYRSAKLRALIVSVSDRRDGWPDPELIATPEIEQREQIIHIPGRPRWR